MGVVMVEAQFRLARKIFFLVASFRMYHMRMDHVLKSISCFDIVIFEN
jgi:hypothetical protein